MPFSALKARQNDQDDGPGSICEQRLERVQSVGE